MSDRCQIGLALNLMYIAALLDRQVSDRWPIPRRQVVVVYSCIRPSRNPHPEGEVEGESEGEGEGEGKGL